MTSIYNRAIAEHVSKLNYCVSLNSAATVQFQDRTTYANYPFVSNQKPPGAILNFLLLFRNLDTKKSNCCHAGFENDIISNHKVRYMISNVQNINERIIYDFQYDLINYSVISAMVLGEVAVGTYIFIPESYVWHLSNEHPNRTGMIVKLQARTYNSKPLSRTTLPERDVPNHMVVLACLARQSGYPQSFTTSEVTIQMTDLAYMPILCSSDTTLIRDIIYSHGFTLEFSLPIEFEVRDAQRVPGISYGIGILGDAYFTTNSTLITNYIIQPYSAIRFWGS